MFGGGARCTARLQQLHIIIVTRWIYLTLNSLVSYSTQYFLENLALYESEIAIFEVIADRITAGKRYFTLYLSDYGRCCSEREFFERAATKDK